jgi:D-alanyl-D-alanine carboxypeptidase
MWKLKLFREYLLSLKHLPVAHSLLASSILLLALLYPGHNSLQTIVINPGPVRAYTLPVISLSLYPQNDGVKAPYVFARAVVVQDVSSKTMMYAKSPDTLLLPASLTKVMTALIALDHWSI